MNSFNFRTNPVRQVLSATVLAGAALVFGTTVYGATKAGAPIKNVATVTYEDAAGNVYTAYSNEAVVTVAQIYSATLGVDINLSAAPGQTVYLPYVLTNTGNGPDTFDLTAVDGITGSDSIDADAITIYHDTNGNGEPSAGEPAISSITIDGSDPVANSVNLVVAVEVPTSATDLQTLGITLTARAQEGTGVAVVGSVTDLTAGGGLDTFDDTNESLITVTGDAVLVVTKSSVHDTANNRITYTVTVKNNGNRPAENVVIWDGLPAGTTYFSSSVSGLLTSNGDIVDTSATLDETLINQDLNADGDLLDASEADLGFDVNTDTDFLDTGVAGVYAIDASLVPTATVSLTFTVSYDPDALGGGYQIQNVGHVTADLNQSGGPDLPVSSVPVSDSVVQTYDVTISDTGTGVGAGVNDGGDDDGVIDGDQLVDSIASGGIVEYSTIITNTGNGPDVFELSAAPNNFPAGTVFTFWDAAGTTQLIDSNSSLGADTGEMLAGASLTIRVKANLPNGVSGDDAGAEYQATVTAQSARDPSGTPASSDVFLSLTTIVAAVADIHATDNGVLGSDQDPLGSPDYIPAVTYEVTLGSTLNIPVFIDNESTLPDAYQLNVGSSWDGTTLGALPAGWSVNLHVGDGAGNPTGAPITSTTSLPGGTIDYEIVAVVSIPADVTQAVDDFSFDNDGDTVLETLDENSDGDGDYPLFFQIVSTSSGATDIVLDAVDVDASHSLALTPIGSQQVEAGGTATYSHTITNTGNVTEIVEITSANSQPGWSNNVSIDTDGNGVADTTMANLVTGTLPLNITVLQGSGTPVTIVVTDALGDGFPELAIPPGADLPIEVNVFAPATDPLGTIDVLTITATNADVTVSVTDSTEIIDSLVRLVKTVAVDNDCNGTADTPFLENQTALVEPGQCAIWQIIANNQSANDAYNVVVTDTIMAFTTYEAGSLEMCVSSGCPLASVSDSTGNDNGEISGNDVKFYLGTGANAATPEGGTLIAGEFATMRFRVKVD
ncbi:MAG: DUF11 domain-containing protein [Granulosicoccus sp.]|nr:DUF11 domain-containing protein [Granulosicoccus sp.]